MSDSLWTQTHTPVLQNDRYPLFSARAEVLELSRYSRYIVFLWLY
jgi:hypothetical protein